MSRYHTTIPNAAYHITFNTKFRIPYFTEDLFCYILANVIHSGQTLKSYALIAYKINPEHTHILLKCGTTHTLSEIVHSIRRVSAVRINQVITTGTVDERVKLLLTEDLEIYSRAFKAKYGEPSAYPYPLFKWQEGFDDKLMRSARQLHTVRRYIRQQADHHNLMENVHLYVSKKIPTDIKFPEGKERQLKSRKSGSP